MSHYKMAAVGFRYGNRDEDRLYDLLDKYDENRAVDPYVIKTRDEALADFREVIEKYKSGEYSGTYKDAILAQENADEDEMLRFYANEYCANDLDEHGNLLSTYNPDSMYDYFGIVDDTTIGDILDSSFENSDVDDEDVQAFWDSYVINELPDDTQWYKPEYYRERYGNVETYIRYLRTPPFWGVVTPEGEWHQPGEVGWFGCDSADKDGIVAYVDWVEEYLKSWDRDTPVAILDCHI